MVALVVVGGSFGYWLLGLTPIDALYQTVTTVTTVGFRELGEFDTRMKVFTIILIVLGVGTVLFTLSLGMQMLVEGQLREILGRRRMDKKIAELSGHVVLCGWGRVGRAVAADLQREGYAVVVVDSDPLRVAGVALPLVVGDATQDATLRDAGIERAQALVAALADDADNLFVTLSGRAIKPSLFIVARARQDESIPKLARAGADRVVNPQELGAARMASFVARPHVAEFVDVVMHERSHEFRMQEVEIPAHSPLDGVALADADLRLHSGALVLALRDADGSFVTNPDPSTRLRAHQIVIAVGTEHDLGRLVDLVNRPSVKRAVDDAPREPQ
ncbi:potassium channel protein [soil metagenome]